jgi:putative hydrolase of the HAD superfamily
VIFDLFRTLVRGFTPGDEAALLAAMAEAAGAPADELVRRWAETAAARTRGELAAEDVLRSLGAEAALAARREVLRAVLEPLPGALEALAETRRRGLRVGLLSNCSSDVPALFRETPLAACVDDAVFSCDVGLAKPDERIYRLVCARLAVDPRDCVFVDDHEENLEAARRVGMEAVPAAELSSLSG